MMSKKKKALLGLLAIALAIGANEGYRWQHERTPYLVGHCFLMEDGAAILIPKTIEGKDRETGKKVTAYLGILAVGPFQVPQPLRIPETNAMIKNLLSEKKAVEVNCETGQPLAAAETTRRVQDFLSTNRMNVVEASSETSDSE